MSALDKIDEIRSIMHMRQSILRIRNMCESDDGIVYYPRSDIKLPKARWLSSAAAASFPKGIQIELVLEKSELDRKSIQAYCTSVNNPTSAYLSIKDDIVYINSDGIEWLLSLLVKDKQISEK
jgi:hypothetical protein